MRKLTLVLLLVVMAIMNPSKAEYVSWVKDKYMEQVNRPLESNLTIFLLQPLIESTTTSKDFMFFSIYKTTLGKNNSTQVLGIFNTFIEIAPNSDSKYAY